jgi:hypothetical protein
MLDLDPYPDPDSMNPYPQLWFLVRILFVELKWVSGFRCCSGRGGESHPQPGCRVGGEGDKYSSKFIALQAVLETS